LLCRKPQLEFKIRGMRCMASKAVIFHDWRMDTLFAALIFVALVTDL
jgi:hypothetical protein